MFYPGQIVVRVGPNDDEWDNKHTPIGVKFPVKKFVKHGALIEDGPFVSNGDGLLLSGLPDWTPCGKYGYTASKFRPLDDGDLALIAQKHKIKEKME